MQPAHTLRLSFDELDRLKKESSPDARAVLAGTISHDYVTGIYSPSESLLALEIMRILARDAAVIVRRALSDQLLQSLDLPRDIALKIASDVKEVSIPFLERSWALSEEDLVELTRATEEVEKLLAIAKRESVSFDLSAALIKKCIDKVTHTVFSNRGALIREEDIAAHLPGLARNETLLEALVKRGGLSLRMAEKLFDVASDKMKASLARTYGLSVQVADNVVASARDSGTLDLTENVSETDVEELVDQLYKRDRLTFPTLLRALCKGDLRFFEIALARLADIPIINARILMLDPGDMGFRSLYQTAGLPENFYEAVNKAVRAMLEETGFGRFTRRDLRLRVHARLKKETFDHIENMDYLLSMIGMDHDAASFH